MHVYTNDHDWVVAENREDAVRQWCEHMGEDFEAYADMESAWVSLPGDKLLCFSVDECGSICPTDDTCTALTMPCAAWVIKEGRGYLGSEDE